MHKCVYVYIFFKPPCFYHCIRSRFLLISGLEFGSPGYGSIIWYHCPKVSQHFFGYFSFHIFCQFSWQFYIVCKKGARKPPQSIVLAIPPWHAHCVLCRGNAAHSWSGCWSGLGQLHVDPASEGLGPSVPHPSTRIVIRIAPITFYFQLPQDLSFRPRAKFLAYI